MHQCTHPSCVLLSHIQSWGQAAQGLRVFILNTVCVWKHTEWLPQNKIMVNILTWMKWRMSYSPVFFDSFWIALACHHGRSHGLHTVSLKNKLNRMCVTTTYSKLKNEREIRRPPLFILYIQVIYYDDDIINNEVCPICDAINNICFITKCKVKVIPVCWVFLF